MHINKTSLFRVCFKQKITHMWRRCGTPQNFFLAFIDKLEKQLIFFNNFNFNWNGPMKNKIILIFTMLYFFKKKIKKHTCRYHYQNLDDMIYTSWDIEQNILILVILGHLLPFYPPKTSKIKILKNEKICWRYHRFTHVYQKSQPYDVRFLRYGVRQAEFFVILGNFLPF